MARDTELQNLVDEFLYLVEVGSGSAVADESELGHLLDRLALAMRTLIVPGPPSGRSEAVPERNVEILRKVAASRFPRQGGGAVGDVATIADHLHAVAWLWRNASFEAGLAYLDESHRTEWGRPMRALQLYLFENQRVDGAGLQDTETAARSEGGRE